MLTKGVDRDTIKNNAQVLTIAANVLGLRVGVKTCQVHVEALYTLMSIPCPGSCTWMIIPVSIWLVTIISIYPNSLISFDNGLQPYVFMYSPVTNWDDHPSSCHVEMRLVSYLGWPIGLATLGGSVSKQKPCP